MASQLFQDPTTTMSPGQLAELKSAGADPIGTSAEAESELGKLEVRAREIKENLRHANRTRDQETLLPDSVPDDVKEQVRAEAEGAVSAVEKESRRDLAILRARAQEIAKQLDEARSQPDTRGIPAQVLAAATALQPLLTVQLQRASLPDIAKRVRGAAIRDDQAELLSLSMVLPGLLDAIAERDDDGGQQLAVHDIRRALRESSRRYRDTSLDSTHTHAETVAADLGRLDSSILRESQERTGDVDPFGYLDGMR